MSDHINEKMWHGFLSYFLNYNPDIANRIRHPLGIGDDEIVEAKSKLSGSMIPDLQIETGNSLVLVETKIFSGKLDDHQRGLLARRFHKIFLKSSPEARRRRLIYTIVCPTSTAENIRLPETGSTSEFKRKRKKTSDEVYSYKFSIKGDTIDKNGVRILDYSVKLQNAPTLATKTKSTKHAEKNIAPFTAELVLKPFKLEVRVVSWRILQNQIGTSTSVRLSDFFPEA